MEELNSEYDAFLVNTGRVSKLFDIYLNNAFGPGRWVGKAFGKKDQDKKNYGYNLFDSDKRTIKFETFIKQTKFNKIDDKIP